VRIRRLATMITMTATAVVVIVAGCGGSTTPPRPQAFELDGAWTYLGPSDGPHDLTIGDDSMVYTDVAGTWSSKWTIKSYDNGLHHFRVAFVSGTGTYLPVGQSMSGTYDLKDKLLTIQLANDVGSYPPLQSAGTCTSETDGSPVPDCRLYIKQN
jgi:hypothetical protein